MKFHPFFGSFFIHLTFFLFPLLSIAMEEIITAPISTNDYNNLKVTKENYDKIQKLPDLVEFLSIIAYSDQQHEMTADEALASLDGLFNLCTTVMEKGTPQNRFLMENTLFSILPRQYGSIFVWPFFNTSDEQRKRFAHKAFSLFESRSDMWIWDKIEILNQLMAYDDQRDVCTAYILGLIRRKELSLHACLETIRLLDYNQLSLSDWLSIVDLMVMTPPWEDINWKKHDIPPKYPFTSDRSKKTLQNLMCISEKLYINFLSKNLKKSGSTNPNTLQKLRLMHNKNEAVFHYKVSYDCLRESLQEANFNPKISMTIFEHLRQISNDTALQHNFLIKCTKYINVRTPLSMNELGRLTQWAHEMGDHQLGMALTKRAHPMIKSPPYKSLITFVSNDQPRGDGINPETFDYYGSKGERYLQLSLIAEELLRRHFLVEVLSFTDTAVRWQDEGVLFPETLWGWTKVWSDFDKWLNHLKLHKVPLLPSVEFFQWSCRKTYLADLQEASIPVIPTFIVPEESTDTLEKILERAKKSFGTSDLIFKGVIGAGGAEYLHIDLKNLETARLKLDELKNQRGGVVVQPFWKEVREKGELSYVFIGGALALYYLKLCAPDCDLVQVFHGGKSFHLKKDDLYREVEDLFKKLKEFRSDLKLTLGDLLHAQSHIYELLVDLKLFFEEKGFPMPPVFRLDCIMKDNQLYIMEIEPIPYLEMGKAETYPPEMIVNWYADEIIRRKSIYEAKKSLKICHLFAHSKNYTKHEPINHLTYE